jgi:hypothetical protein
VATNVEFPERLGESRAGQKVQLFGYDKFFQCEPPVQIAKVGLGIVGFVSALALASIGHKFLGIDSYEN